VTVTVKGIASPVVTSMPRVGKTYYSRYIFNLSEKSESIPSATTRATYEK
jgi:hypothetical protein